jgi:hypothetical protein
MKRLALALSLLCGACGQQVVDVKVSLSRGVCDDPGVAYVQGVWAVLQRRDPPMVLQSCTDLRQSVRTLADLQTRLGEIALDYIPESGMRGSWDMWVVGTGDRCCQAGALTETFLCGVQHNLILPPTDNRLTLPVACIDPLSSDINKGPSAEAVKKCGVARPTLGPAPPCGPL